MGDEAVFAAGKVARQRIVKSEQVGVEGENGSIGLGCGLIDDVGSNKGLAERVDDAAPDVDVQSEESFGG